MNQFVSNRASPEKETGSKKKGSDSYYLTNFDEKTDGRRDLWRSRHPTGARRCNWQTYKSGEEKKEAKIAQ